jgi:diguanylate cyclase (GGDEF)-like protein
MESWQDRFQQMKDQFITKSRARLNSIETLIEMIENDPQDGMRIRELRQHFHWLAGSGGTYGMPEVSKLGGYGEDGCEFFLSKQQAPGAADIQRFKGILQSVQVAFDGLKPAVTEAPFEGTPSAEAEKTEERIEIMIVDGDPNHADSVGRLLEEEGMHILSFANVAQARQRLGAKAPQGLILVLPLPDESAYELTEQCRMLTGGNKTAIIIMSRQTGFLDKVKAIHAGCDAFFEDTVDVKEVVSKLNNLLEKDKPELYRILHVEDDLDQAEFIKATLESAGYNVCSLPDAAKFEEWLVAVQPDIVILDVMLGGEITGFDLARYMRQDERYATVPILFLTTQNQLYAHIESARAGGDDHMVKPVHPPLLCATVAGRLENARVLKSLVDKDGLTKFLTHGAFMQRAQAVAKSQRGTERAAMLIMDIDYLKEVNDRYGYATGDKVLLSMANLLRKRFRGTDIIGRLSGDEFGIVFESLGESELANLAVRILKEFEQIEHNSGSGKFKVTFSAGACMLEEGMDMDRWLKLAEQALRAAKSEGRNRVMQARAGKAQ